jgi:hypothetical protein
MSDAYKEELLDKYYPEDSTRIYAWNMVQWAGRWMVTIGSGGDFATGPAQMWMKANPAKVPGFVNKAGPAAPVLTALQGLGYLAQFAAEIFEKQVREAADVRNYFRAAHDQLWQLSINLRNELDGDGLTWTFYTVAEKLAMEASIRAFDWAPMDRLLVETRLKPYLAQETMAPESSDKGVTVSR